MLLVPGNNLWFILESSSYAADKPVDQVGSFFLKIFVSGAGSPFSAIWLMLWVNTRSQLIRRSELCLSGGDAEQL